MSDTRIAEHLAAFGLSSTEIDTYLAVLRRGEATTGEIATAADVSQGYVYDVTGSLVDRGLVTVDEAASPTVVRARPAGEAVAELSRRLSDLQSGIADVYGGPAATDEVSFEMLRSRGSVERRIERFLADATHEAFLVVPATAFERLREDLAAARERGVTVYLCLVAPDVDVVADAVADFGTYATVVRTWDARPHAFVLRDNREGLVGSHGVLTGGHGEEYAVVFGQPEITNGFYGNMVSNVWSMAESCFVADPPALPATFEYFRSGVTAAARHLHAGRDLVADVDVVDTDSEGERTLTGVPVVEVRQTLVDPETSTFPVENALVVETDQGRVSVGGDSAGFDPYFEDFAARELTLREA